MKMLTPPHTDSAEPRWHLPARIRLIENRFRTLFAVGLATLLFGCSTASVDDHATQAPAFAPENFFSGSLSAHGVVKNFSGSVIRHFQANIIGCWENGVGTLDEDFVFDDGEEQTRIWTLTPDGDQTYIGTAGDVVGNGEARWAGNAMYLDYTCGSSSTMGPSMSESMTECIASVKTW